MVIEMEAYVPTKSLQRIFTPIVSQITELMIVTSDGHGTESNSESTSLLLPLVSMSEDIVNTLNDLTIVCKQTVAMDYTGDEVVKQEVDCASQNLLVSSESLVLCCHILCSSPKPNFQLQTPVPHQSDVASCLSDLNQCLLLLLLSVDDAEVRKIADAGRVASDGLALLTTAETVQVLKDQFRSFAESAANLHRSASARCSDLLDVKDQYNLKCCLTTLRQSLPMLTAALQMAIKYSDNAEVMKGRNFCVEQVRKAVADIIRIVTTKRPRKRFLPDTKKGLFAEKLEEVSEMLSTENRKVLKMIMISSTVETFVQHCIELSLHLSKSSNTLQQKSNSVVKCCRRFMRALHDLEKSDEDLEKQASSQHNLGNTRDENCTKLCGVAKGVMATVTHAVSSLVTHAFTFTEEPLSILVDTCVPPSREGSTELIELKQESVMERLELISKSFQEHVESITGATKFAASCCGHSASYQKYSKVLASFEQTSKAIPLVARGYFTEKNEHRNDLVQYDRILDLQERWIATVSDIIQLIVASLDLKDMLEVLVEGVFNSAEKCNEGIANLDENLVAKHLQEVTGKSRFLVRVANAVVTCSTEPVYRNGVLSHVKELKQNIANVIAHGNQIIDDVARVNEQELFKNSAVALKDSVKTVAKAVLSDGNHPDLTSLDRLNVRDDDGSSQAAVKSLYSLNERLSAMGFEPITDDENDTFPVPTSGEPGWPRYFYKDDAPVQLNVGTEEDTSRSGSDILSEPVQKLQPDLESLPGKIHPIIANLLNRVKKTHASKTAKSWGLDDAKELVARASEICNDIAKESLIGPPTDVVTDDDKQSVQKASVRIASLVDLVLKEVDDLCKTPKDEKLDTESLHLLGLQWSRSLYIISVGCVRILPLYTVPVRRYLALSLGQDVEDIHSIARYLVRYPGSLSKLISKLAEFKRGSWQDDGDNSGIGDFNVHEQNVKELVELVGAIFKLFKMSCDEDVEDFNPDQVEELSGLFEIIDFDWSSACKYRKELLELVDNISMKRDEDPVDKALLQLVCLSWACKTHSLHGSVFKLAKLMLEYFGAEVKAVSLYEMVADEDRETSREIKSYRQRVLVHVAEQERAMKSATHTDNITTWNENLKDTADVIEDTLGYLCSVRTSIPLVHHHGHTMFHFAYLHHLFFLELVYLNLSMTQPTTEDEASEISETEEPSIRVKRPSLSARLQALKEERERRDESLQDLLVDVPKTGL